MHALCLCRPKITTDLATTLVLSSMATWLLAATLQSLFALSSKLSSQLLSLLLSSQVAVTILWVAVDLIAVLDTVTTEAVLC